MARTRSRWGRGLVLVAAVAAVAGAFGATGELLAGKPGGGGGGTTNPPDIAYLVHGSTSALYVMQDDGTGQTAVLQGQFDCGPPSWSPDGARLAFPSDVQGQGIYTIRWDGTGLTKVASTSVLGSSLSYPASWSPTLPDGRQWIAFTDRDPQQNQYDLYIVDPGTGTRVRLTNTSGIEDDHSWSRDGTRLAFGPGRMWVIDFTPDAAGAYVPGTPYVLYTPSGWPSTSGFDYEWAKTSNRVLFHMFVGTYADLFVLDPAAPLSGTNPRNVTGTSDVEELAGSWSPDDRYVLTSGFGVGGIARVDVATGARTLLARNAKGKSIGDAAWRR